MTIDLADVDKLVAKGLSKADALAFLRLLRTPFEDGPIAAEILPFREAKAEFEREYCERILALTRGNVTQAARLSGKDRKDFYDLLARTGVRPRRFG